jgi:hypothetical protein
VLRLLEAGGRVGAALHGEIVAADDDGASVDLRHARHDVRRLEGGAPACGIDLDVAGGRTELAEALGVDQVVDPLADGQATPRVMPGDSLGSAQLMGQAPPLGDLVDVVLPAHGRGG